MSNAKAHWLGLVGYKTRGPADIRRPIEQSFLERQETIFLAQLAERDQQLHSMRAPEYAVIGGGVWREARLP